MSTANENKIPTKSELEALKVLWQHGPSTARFVHETLTKELKEVRYTSTLKMMQVMTEKGMLRRDESKMTHIYYPLLEERPTLGAIANRFVQSMYEGSISNLLVAFMDNKPASKNELQELKALLNDLDEKNIKS